MILIHITKEIKNWDGYTVQKVTVKTRVCIYKGRIKIELRFVLFKMQ